MERSDDNLYESVFSYDVDIPAASLHRLASVPWDAVLRRRKVGEVHGCALVLMDRCAIFNEHHPGGGHSGPT